MSILYSKSYDINLTVRNCNVYFHIPIEKSKSILTIFTLFSIDETDTVEYLKTVFCNEKVLKILVSASSTYHHYSTERAQVYMDFQGANQF